jgi:hypothetical protein
LKTVGNGLKAPNISSKLIQSLLRAYFFHFQAYFITSIDDSIFKKSQVLTTRVWVPNFILLASNHGRPLFKKNLNGGQGNFLCLISREWV